MRRIVLALLFAVLGCFPALGQTVFQQNQVWAGPTSGSGFGTARSLVGGDLPNPSGSTLGGVQSLTCAANQWLNSISIAGVPACAQPAFSNLSGSLACSQHPALTGDTTTSAGACATTTAKVNGVAYGAAPATDTVPIITAANTATYSAVPNCTSGVLQYSTATHLFSCGATSAIQWPFPEGRLTLTSGTPVMATSVAGATTVYYTGYAGKNVPIYNGTAVTVYQLCAANTVGACELSVALGSNWGANSNYDWFIALNGGNPTLCTGPAWTSDTTRGSGAGTTQLAQLDGLNTNAVSLPNCRINNTTTISVAANQGTYVGSMRTGSAGQTNFIYGASAAGGTAGSFGIWNAYNRITIRTTVNDSTASWNYTSATVRPVDNSTANRVSFLSGLSESGFSWNYATTITFPAAAANAFFQIGGAFDSTTTFDRNGTALNATTTGMHLPISVRNNYNPTIGWHFVQALEGGDGTNANTSGGTTQQAFTFEFEM